MIKPLGLSTGRALSNWFPNVSDSAFHLCFSSVLSYALPLQSVFQKPCQGNFVKFQGSGESRFGGSEKDRFFSRFQNGSIYLFGITNEES